jgi:tetratricopeptide (TPR) repeat protein
MKSLARAYEKAGKAQQALPLLEAILQVRKTILGLEHPETLTSMNNLAVAYRNAGKLDRALPLFAETLQLHEAKLGPDHPNTWGCMRNLGLCLLRAGKPADAEPVLRQLALRQEKREPDAWALCHTQSVLGESLLGQKKYGDAEPLLLQGYEGMQRRQALIPVQARRAVLADALERLVRFYEATGQKQKADEWQRKLENAKKDSDQQH